MKDTDAMQIDYTEMFDNADDLADHVMKPISEQRRIEAEWLQENGKGSMVCDLTKKKKQNV